MRLQGHAWRALNPIWAHDPLSGEGARRHGGRFNPRGTAALYCALDVMTAIREVSQVGQPLQPTTIVTYEIDVTPVFDATDPALLDAQEMTPADIAASDWRQVLAQGQVPRTQDFAVHLVAQGYAALRVPSFAHGSRPEDLNLVLWRWGPDLPVRVRLIDPERRLGPT